MNRPALLGLAIFIAATAAFPLDAASADDRKIFVNTGNPFGMGQTQGFRISPKALALRPQIQPFLTDAYRAHLNGDYFHALLAFKGYYQKMVDLWPESDELTNSYFEGRAPGRNGFEPLPTQRVADLTLEDIQGALSRPKSNVDPHLIREICGLLRDHFDQFIKGGALVEIETRLKMPRQPVNRSKDDMLAVITREKDVNQLGFDSAKYEDSTADILTTATRSTDTSWGAYLTFVAGARHIAVLGKIYELADSQQQAVSAFTTVISSYSGSKFPIDDPISGARAGNPIEPYARLLLARVYGNWKEGNTVYGRPSLEAEQLQKILKNFSDPALMMDGPYGNGKVSMLGSAFAGLIRRLGKTPESKAVAEHFADDLPNMQFAWNGWWLGETRPESFQFLAQMEDNKAKKAAYLNRIIEDYPGIWTGKAGSDDGGPYDAQAFYALLQLSSNQNESIEFCKRIIGVTKDAALKQQAEMKLKELTLERDAPKLFTQPATKELPIGACLYTFHYDAAKYSDADIARFAMYSPNSGQWSVILFQQAERRKDLEEATRAASPAMKPLLECYLSELSFMMDMDERKGQYLSTGDVSYISKSIGGVDPKKLCPDMLEAAANAKTSDDRQNALNRCWGNRLNAEFRKHMCSGNALWTKFLGDMGIQEVPSNCDGD